MERAANLTTDDFRALADALPQMAWVAEPNGDIIWYNQRWYDYTGTTIEQMFGWGWRDVHHPDHVERVVGRISEAFRTGEPWKDTFPLRGADGEYRWFLSLAQPHRGPDGAILRWFGTNTDITERKGMERRLARHAIDLRRSNEELEQFAYVAPRPQGAAARHREPRGLDRGGPGGFADRRRPDQHGVTQEPGAAARQPARRSLLAYSRAGRADAATDMVDTKALVEELAVPGQPSGRLRHRADASLPTLRAARAPLTQALQNLIGNAIKHHDRPAEGHIRVDAKPAGDAVEFVVTDDGPGIPEQFRERVFGMFQTLKPRDEVEGSGMGLAIVRKLVDRQGGKVWLSDGPDGRGLAVHFTWPRDGRKGHADGLDG